MSDSEGRVCFMGIYDWRFKATVQAFVMELNLVDRRENLRELISAMRFCREMWLHRSHNIEPSRLTVWLLPSRFFWQAVQVVISGYG